MISEVTVAALGVKKDGEIRFSKIFEPIILDSAKLSSESEANLSSTRSQKFFHAKTPKHIEKKSSLKRAEKSD